MKQKQFCYISVRVTAAFIALGLFCAALLVLLYICAARGAIPAPLAGGLAILFIGILYLILELVRKPYRETRKILRLFAEGYTVEGVYDIAHPYDKATEQALHRLKIYFSNNAVLDDEKRQAQYLALQNQINPHFLYNTLEGIRGEALVAGLDSVAEMTEALATFFRYTISGAESFVTVEDELTNVENYFIIQQFRFGEKLRLSIEYDEKEWPEIQKCRLPKLTLQPIAENAIIHGIEQKLGVGTLRIKLAVSRTRLLITVSDDGVGIPSDKLQELNDLIRRGAPNPSPVTGERRGGIAMLNVNNRIKLLFGEEYGIHVYSTAGVGTDVEISLPHVTRLNE